MNSILAFSKNEVSKWVRAHRTMLIFAQHLSEAGKYPYIVCYIHRYNYILTGSLGWIRKLKKDSQGREKSL